MYGRRAPWEDPTDWSLQTYPWANVNPGGGPDRSLLHIRPEDVGYDTIPPSSPSTVPALGNTKTPLKGENPPQDSVDPLVSDFSQTFAGNVIMQTTSMQITSTFTTRACNELFALRPVSIIIITMFVGFFKFYFY